MPKNSFEKPKGKTMTDAQVSADIRRMFNDIGDAARAGGRLQFFWRIERLTGIAAARVTSLFYSKGVRPSVPEYIAARQAWEQLAATADMAALHTDIINTGDRLDAIHCRATTEVLDRGWTLFQLDRE